MRCRPRLRISPSSPLLVQEGIQEAPFGLAVYQAGAEFAEHRVVETRIGQLQCYSHPGAELDDICAIMDALYRFPIRAT